MKVLNDVELKSAVWIKIEAHLESRISSLHKELELDLDTARTAKIRGRIAEIRKILLFDSAPLNIKQETPVY